LALHRKVKQERRTFLVHETGDFQTPAGLVTEVLENLRRKGLLRPRILEPTCGKGNFIAGLLQLASPPHEIQALELQPEYCEIARKIPAGHSTTHICVQQANLFDVPLQRHITWKTNAPLLVVGNPPWVTNAALGSLSSKNLPQKVNLKKLRGLEARTGSSNFDIAEYIWIKLIMELETERPTIALLCKTSVARHVLKYCYDQSLPITRASLTSIDAKTWFNVAVDACLFCIKVGERPANYQAMVYDHLQAEEPTYTIGVKKGFLIANTQSYTEFEHIDGDFPLIWRQGIKHDAASIMELTRTERGTLLNKMGETVVVEEEYVYPLLKGTDVAKNIPPHRFVIVTQRQLGDATTTLQKTAPQLWCYLVRHAQSLDNRKSSIYTNQPRFAMFGVGPYAFAPYKIAISGLHKNPVFRAIGPVEQKPVMLDDTCYFLPMQNPLQTALLTSLLNDEICRGFLISIAFIDAKRPITKKLLQRINLEALIERIDTDQIFQRTSAILQHMEYADDDTQLLDAFHPAVLLDQLLLHQEQQPTAPLQTQMLI
jgi:hypothetical protein